MKTLYIDFEQGYKSLGNKDEIEKNFGLPMLQFDSWKEFKALLGQLLVRSKTKKEVLIDGIKVPQEIIEWKFKEGINIDCIVIDTGTELVKKLQRELQGGKDKLTLQQWGQMKNQIDMLMTFINQIPCSVIFNTHCKSIKDEELGFAKIYPNIEGSSKEDLGKWFDFVFYTKIVKDSRTGNRAYNWVTGRDEKYVHAKDRSQGLPDEMEQNYESVFYQVAKSGWENAKCLVIGDPGSGKTLSLNTLINKENNKEA